MMVEDMARVVGALKFVGLTGCVVLLVSGTPSKIGPTAL
jgi:hypothetical protein